MDIIKRNGKKQKFSKPKLVKGLMKCCKGAKMSSVRCKKLAEGVSSSVVEGLKGKRSIKAIDLRRRVLRRLDRSAKKVARAWRSFDKKRH